MFIDREELERRKTIEHNLIARMRLEEAPPSENSRINNLDTTRFKNDGSLRDQPLYTTEQRALAAATAIVAGPKVAHEVTGVSESYAKVLADGAYSGAATPEERDRRNQELRDAIYNSLGKIRDKATRKLLKVLNLINAETLEAIPDKDKARIAAQMANQLSGVIDRTINKGEHNLDNSRNTHLHLYAPEQRPLAAFEIKHINSLGDGNGKSSAE